MNKNNFEKKNPQKLEVNCVLRRIRGMLAEINENDPLPSIDAIGMIYFFLGLSMHIRYCTTNPINIGYCLGLLTYSDLFLTFDPIHVIDFFLFSSIHARCNKPHQNRTLLKVFTPYTSMTSNDLWSLSLNIIYVARFSDSTDQVVLGLYL